MDGLNSMWSNRLKVNGLDVKGAEKCQKSLALHRTLLTTLAEKAYSY
jgi:hypothetical protein